jgi:RHS repeat-associated protein
MSTPINYVSPGVIRITDKAGATAELRFTADGSLQQVTDPLGRTSRWVYDTNDRAVELIAADNSVTRFSYDAAGNRISQTNALLQTETYSYAAGSKNPTSLVDGKGNPLTYSYDSQGKVTSIGYADGSSETFTFNSTNQLISKVERSGDTFSYSYTPRGLLQGKSGPDFSESYSYDSQDRLIGVSRSTPGGGASQSVSYSYDSGGNLSQISQGGKSISYSYDSQGRRSSYSTSDGATVRYSYDSRGRLSGLRDGSDQSLVGYQYDAAGRLSRETNGNGTATSYSYDAAGQLLRIDNANPAGTVVSSLVYTYDLLGRRTGETSNQGSWSYSYDAIGQLVGADFSSSEPAVISSQSRQYVYDAAGNRISTLVNGLATSYSSNGLNQYASVGGAGYSYDADGNLLSDGVRSYQYNSENRMIRATSGADVWEYEYDLRGNRSAVIENGQRTSYLVDPFAGFGDVVGTYNADGSLQARYVHGNGLVAGFNSGDSWYYEADAIGSIRSLSNGSGAELTPGLLYDPFGAQFGGGSGLSVEQGRFGFVGGWGVEQQDASGMIHMRARQYAQFAGRFTATDPLGVFVGNLNLYGYGWNSPLVFIDPEGELGFLALLAHPIAIKAYIAIGAAVAAGVAGAVTTHVLTPKTPPSQSNSGPGSFTINNNNNNNITKTDPLLLDLGRNGLTFIPLAQSSAFFDLNNNGFRERVSWIGAGEGLLVRDLNNNGRIDHLGEQFGDALVNGFTALAALDSNGDNFIDASDAEFDSLRIWIDRNSDGFTDTGELRTLADLSIESIGLARVDRTNDPDGIRSTGSFTFADGSTSTIAAIDLTVDRLSTLSTQEVDLKLETFFLPGLRGFGALHDLNAAMSQDPVLLGLMRQFVQLDASQLDQINAKIEAILFRWAGVDGIDPTSRSTFFDARKHAFLETFYQSPIDFSITRTEHVSGLRLSWSAIVDYYSSRLAGQGFLRHLLNTPTFDYNYELATDKFVSFEENTQHENNLQAILSAVQLILPTDTNARLLTWSYVLGVLDAVADHFGLSKTAYDAALQIGLGPDLAGSLAALRNPALGSAMADDMQVSRRSGNSGSNAGALFISAGDGDDKITSGRGNDILFGGSGKDSLNGGEGIDYLDGGAGNDTLNGGKGIDTLNGGAGNDTYIVDSTTDVITDSHGIDTVQSSVSFSLAPFSFLENLTLTGSSTINATGNDQANTLTGNSANNILNGGGDDDTLNGGKGIDTLSGGAGNDTYIVYSTTDVITDSDGIDTVQSSVSFSLAPFSFLENLTLIGSSAINATGNDQVNTLTGNRANNMLDGGSSNDTLNGGDGNDTLIGGTGIDILNGGAGNDTLIGGQGSDTLTGGSGRDTFRFTSAPHTNDTDLITDFISGTDKLSFSKAAFTGFGSQTKLTTGQFVVGAGLSAATSPIQCFLFDTNTRLLHFDSDGSGIAQALTVAQFSSASPSHPLLLATDFILTS